MHKSEKFWDRIANKYAGQAIKDVQAYDRMLANTRKYLTCDDAVLDFGCGTGSISIAIAGNVNRISAMDISSRMIAIARSRAEESGLQNINFAHTTLFDKRFEKASFDVVLAFHVLHLLEDTGKALARVGELLRPGGLLISITPCLGENRLLFGLMLPMLHRLGILPCVRLLSLSELEGLHTEQGFHFVETETTKGLPPEYFIVARKS